jgi:hypothetical protein
VHQANLEDSRETLNALNHHGPIAVAAMSANVSAAMNALRAAPLPGRPGGAQPAPAATPRLNNQAADPTAKRAPWAVPETLRFEQFSAQMQRHSEMSARAIEAVLRASLSGLSSATSSFAGRSTSGRVPSDRQRGADKPSVPAQLLSTTAGKVADTAEFTVAASGTVEEQVCAADEPPPHSVDADASGRDHELNASIANDGKAASAH